MFGGRSQTSWRLAKKTKIRTGKVLLYELRGGKHRAWEACVEISRDVRSEGKIKAKKLMAETVAIVHFNPKVSPRLVYHGLNDWLKWRLKDRPFKKLGSSREVYFANPWKRSYAWGRAEVQVLVKKK
jgi:hypothetical protein